VKPCVYISWELPAVQLGHHCERLDVEDIETTATNITVMNLQCSVATYEHFL